MRILMKWLGGAAVLGMIGCAQPMPKEIAVNQPLPLIENAMDLVVFIPHSDAAAGSWFKLFERYPHLRMVIAVSPWFKRFSKEPALKSQALAWQQAGRLELALQVPNAPFLPLLINSDEARKSLPPGSALPTPPFVFPDDAAQTLARAKANFYQLWNKPPQGLVLPHGAVSADLLHLADRLGFHWVLGALGAPPISGAYRVGSLMVFDATPASERSPFTVRVWDERVSGDPKASQQTLAAWAQEIEKKNRSALLPSDPSLGSEPLSETIPWTARTWSAKDWSAWIGAAQKNAAWEGLRKTRQALENYKNSGRASVHHLDAAFEEMYTAENSNFLSSTPSGGGCPVNR